MQHPRQRRGRRRSARARSRAAALPCCARSVLCVLAVPLLQRRCGRLLHRLDDLHVARCTCTGCSTGPVESPPRSDSGCARAAREPPSRNPGVQKPHCSAKLADERLLNRMKRPVAAPAPRSSSPRVRRPEPPASGTTSRARRPRAPSRRRTRRRRSPTCVPVSPSCSRRKCTRSVRGSTSPSHASPLTRSAITCFTTSLPVASAGRQAAVACAAAGRTVRRRTAQDTSGIAAGQHGRLRATRSADTTSANSGTATSAPSSHSITKKAAIQPSARIAIRGATRWRRHRAIVGFGRPRLRPTSGPRLDVARPGVQAGTKRRAPSFERCAKPTRTSPGDERKDGRRGTASRVPRAGQRRPTSEKPIEMAKSMLTKSSRSDVRRPVRRAAGRAAARAKERPGNAGDRDDGERDHQRPRRASSTRRANTTGTGSARRCRRARARAAAARAASPT